jgi:hypothetical protein
MDTGMVSDHSVLGSLDARVEGKIHRSMMRPLGILQGQRRAWGCWRLYFRASYVDGAHRSCKLRRHRS